MKEARRPILFTLVLNLVVLSGITAQEPNAPSTAKSQPQLVQGTMVPTGPPIKKPVLIEAGKSCIVELVQGYAMTGSLNASLEVDYRIWVQGPCGSPPGTFDEEWIAFGSIAEKEGEGWRGNLTYIATVKAGGLVQGQMEFGQGLEGELKIQGKFSDGRLAYEGWIDSSGEASP